MRPAQRAVAGVDPQAAHLGLADEGNIGGCGRAQTGPELGLATFFNGAGVAHAGPDFFDTARQHAAACARQGALQAQVVAAHLNRAGHPNLVAQAGNGDFLGVVDGGYRGRGVCVQNFERGAVALARVNRQIHAHAAQERRAKRAAGHHHLVGAQHLRGRRHAVASLGLRTCHHRLHHAAC